MKNGKVVTVKKTSGADKARSMVSHFSNIEVIPVSEALKPNGDPGHNTSCQGVGQHNAKYGYSFDN
jgi:hypothetical protein